MSKLPTRQIHLDFHTSELIPDVGSRFDKGQWQEALRLGRVNWINVFAKCHHGWSYYPTRAGAVHPTLQRDLLGEQIAACHEIGVRAPIYYTVGWSAHDAETHPEWTVKDREGRTVARNVDPNARPEERRPGYSWQFLCPSGGYRELMLAQTRELCERYDVDGFWYDICTISGPCYCPNCLAGMAAEGLDPAREEDAQRYLVLNWQRFMAACNEVIHAAHPQATVFYNGTTGIYSPDYTPWMTQIELEDLPTTWGGYDKFPLRSRFFATKDKPMVAMSGKFHTSWGEFGGFKHPDALRFEAASMIAYGVACNFGDQLHPLGEMDPATYRNIGAAFQYVEQIEDYGPGGEPCANLGLWLTGDNADDQGVANMLLESQTDFAVALPGADLSRFETVILTGARCLDEGAAAQLEAYVAAGGSLLVLGESALDAAGERFLLDVGAEYVGPAQYELDYLLAGPALGEEMVETPFLNYAAALRCRPTTAEVLAQIREPYFDRTYAHYCSHLNTPYQPVKAAHPGALRRGRVLFLPHRLGALYYEHGARLHRQFFHNALRLVYRRPFFTVRLPSSGRVSVLQQREERRYVAHLLYGAPLQRGRCLVIEDLPPLYDVPVALCVPEAIWRAYLVPGGREVALEQQGDGVHAIIPKVACHQAIVFEY